MSKTELTHWGAESLQPETLAIRAGHRRSAEREHSESIFATSSFVFEDAEQAAELFAEKAQGNIYSRFTNPTVTSFENRLGALEGAEYCVATSSGMAAITGLVLSCLKPGDHVVIARELFGSTVSLFNKLFSRFNISVTMVSLADTAAWSKALTPATKMLFVETPTNPLCDIADLRKLAEIAKAAGALLVVDNCFCTPVLQQPLKLGADIVIHSATKYLDGQGRCVGGAMATNNEELHNAYFGMVRTTGPSMSPFNAWVFLKGLETLSLRMEKHCANAAAIAHWLCQQDGVEKVFYPGLKDHPGHQLALSQQSGFGGILSFTVSGGKEAAWQLINQTQLLSITANLGDVKSTITHPASTTHARITQQDRDLAGVSDNLIRLSVGLEAAVDIQNDISRGLNSLAN